MYNVNWQFLIRIFDPAFWRDPTTLSWLGVLVSQVKALHLSFLSWKALVDQKLLHNGQVIYLTKLLNDKYDPIGRGIYIDTISDTLYTYLFNFSEQQPEVFLYNKYAPATTYAIGEYAQTSTGVYRAIVSSTGQNPDSSPLSWSFEHAPIYLFNYAEITLQLDFIVFVPIALVFDPLALQVDVNYYKVAGKRYTIRTY